MAKKTATFSIDGKKVKQIVKLDKSGNEVWTKFKPESSGINQGFHFITKNPSENHRDIYVNGKQVPQKQKIQAFPHP